MRSRLQSINGTLKNVAMHTDPSLLNVKRQLQADTYCSWQEQQ
jgi:hypothetical protein